MAAYRISYYLYRSNPVILREIKVPAEGTVQDLAAVFCLAMGISVVPGCVWDEDEQMVEGERKLLDLFGTGETFHQMTGRAVIYQDEKRQAITSLTFFFEVLEEMDEVLSVPDIIWGEEFQLPQNVFRISLINEILVALQHQESYTASGMGSFYRGQQEFNLKKTHNFIYAYFAPDKVSTLKTELAVPLPTVLENKTVNELKVLSEYHRAYVYNYRKADYIAALCGKLSEIDSQRLFYEMDMLEYQNFRELVVEGKSSCKDNDALCVTFPVLSQYGMISISKKTGIFIYSAILQDYEEWFDQEEEIRYRIGKRIASVMNGCAAYYGVFTKEICQKTLDRLYPEEVSEEMLERFWKKPFDGARLWNVSFSKKMENGEKAAYETSLFNAKELPFYLKVLTEDHSERYLPSKYDLEWASHSGCEANLKNFGKLFLFVRPYAYDDPERKELCHFCIDCMRKGYPLAETSKKTVERFHRLWGGKEKVQQDLEVLLKEIVNEVPDILYYGYPLAEAKAKNISANSRKEFNRLVVEAEEAAKRAKQAKQEAAEKRRAEAAAQKKATAKTTRTTGRRGLK